MPKVEVTDGRRVVVRVMLRVEVQAEWSVEVKAWSGVPRFGSTTRRALLDLLHAKLGPHRRLVAVDQLGPRRALGARRRGRGYRRARPAGARRGRPR